MRVPLHMLEGVVCFGNITATPFLMGRCVERNIGIAFMTERGRLLARVQPAVSGNVLLRRAQYRWADHENRSAGIARACVIGKVSNCRRVLQRAARDHRAVRTASRVDDAVRKLRWNLSKLQTTGDVDAIRGLEGDAARTYFDVFGDLITAGKETFAFRSRTRRPPRDPINALLSFVYSLLLHDVESASGAVGLDPQVGFLHRDRPGRAGLALDLMEEMRPLIADRVVLSLVNRRQVSASGFEVRETGGVNMSDDTRRAVLAAYQERKQEELIHPFLNEKLTVGRIPFVQALLLARHLRGDLDGYPPFLWK